MAAQRRSCLERAPIVKRDRSVFSRRGHGSAVGRNRGVPARPVLAALRVSCLKPRNARVPQVDRAIGRGACQLPAARRERHAGDPVRMAIERGQLTAAGWVPKLHRAVEAAAGKKLPARRERQRKHHVLVAVQRSQLRALHGVPKLDGGILAAAGEKLATGREGKRADLAVVAAQLGPHF